MVDQDDTTNVTMPVNETVCLKDNSGELPVYMIEGEVSANGRVYLGRRHGVGSAT